MATVRLKIAVAKINAGDVWMVIDNQDISFDGAGNGVADVDRARLKHRYVVWVEGPPGASADIEIDQDGNTLVTTKPTVNWGNREQVEHNDFALKH